MKKKYTLTVVHTTKEVQKVHVWAPNKKLAKQYMRALNSSERGEHDPLCKFDEDDYDVVYGRSRDSYSVTFEE